MNAEPIQLRYARCSNCRTICGGEWIFRVPTPDGASRYLCGDCYGE